MIRFICACTFLGLYFLIGIPIWLVLWLIGRFKPKARQKASQALVKWGFGIILWMAGAKVTVKGRENIPTDTAVLYVSNHQSFFDVLVGYTTVVGCCGFVAKKELEKAPFLRDWMYAVKCLFIDREDMKQSMKVILAAAEQLKEGTSVWICPEGTRNKNPEEVQMLEFKDGSFKPADRAKVPVVPVAIRGTWALFERQMPKFKKSAITVEYGTPFLMSDLDPDDKKHVGAYTQAIIAGMLQEMDAAVSAGATKN